ncbi:hypothetical protein [Leifsonia shinshuensis]
MTLINTEALAEILPEAAQMVQHWNSGEVLHHLNMSEGFTFAALWSALGQDEVAQHIIREVWEGESPDSRDPLPWTNTSGERKSDVAVTYADRFEADAESIFTFEPRQLDDVPDGDWEQEEADQKEAEAAARALA